MRHLRADIDCTRHFFDRVHVFGKALPIPLNTFGERGAGNILDPFHQADQKFFLAGLDGSETDSAISHHQSSDAVPTRRSEVRVPRDLAIIMSMDIDEAGRDEESGRVDFAPTRTSLTADTGDLAAVDPIGL